MYSDRRVVFTLTGSIRNVCVLRAQNFKFRRLCLRTFYNVSTDQKDKTAHAKDDEKNIYKKMIR